MHLKTLKQKASKIYDICCFISNEIIFDSSCKISAPKIIFKTEIKFPPTIGVEQKCWNPLFNLNCKDIKEY